MTLQTSGIIKLSEIGTEFEDTAPHALTEFYGVDSEIPSSGNIALTDFYGASSGLILWENGSFIPSNTHEFLATSNSTINPTASGISVELESTSFFDGTEVIVTREETEIGVEFKNQFNSTVLFSDYQNLHLTIETGSSISPDLRLKADLGTSLGNYFSREITNQLIQSSLPLNTTTELIFPYSLPSSTTDSLSIRFQQQDTSPRSILNITQIKVS